MVGYNPKARKKYCDLQCYNCDGFWQKECLLNGEGNHMRLLRTVCLGEHRLISTYTPRDDTYWKDNFCLSAKLIGNKDFPNYHGELEH